MTNLGNLGVVILGAGASVRMGTPKLLLPWGDTTVLGHLVRTWRDLGVEPIAVVVAAEGSPIEAELDRLAVPRERRIRNPDPAAGMFSSICCGAGWTGWAPAVGHVVLSLGDQPLVRRETLLRLIAFARAHPACICQLTRDGRPRHPVVFPVGAWSELRGTHEPTLRDFLEARAACRRFLECDDPGLDLDLDLPADYRRAMAQRKGETS